MTIKGKFVFLVGNAVVEVNKLEDAPKEYDNLIAFVPEYPEPPHNEEQHNEIEQYQELFEKYFKGAK